MAWRHISSNQEAWELREAGLLWWKARDRQEYVPYSPTKYSTWTYPEWMRARFDGESCGKNYIQVDE